MELFGADAIVCLEDAEDELFVCVECVGAFALEVVEFTDGDVCIVEDDLSACVAFGVVACLFEKEESCSDVIGFVCVFDDSSNSFWVEDAWYKSVFDAFV